jgi:hypothetical protein
VVGRVREQAVSVVKMMRGPISKEDCEKIKTNEIGERDK